MNISAADILDRIAGLDGTVRWTPLNKSLMAAYISCLDFHECCSVIELEFEKNSDLRLLLRKRLIRILENEGELDFSTRLAALINNLNNIVHQDKRLKVQFDAICSALFNYLPPPTKQWVLDNWMDRGTRSAGRRWLKATKNNPDYFDFQSALEYWRHTDDEYGAIALALQSDPRDLNTVIKEIIERCRLGWVIGKCAIRCKTISEDCWLLIYTKFPATYLYACAKLEREVSFSDAIHLTTLSSETGSTDDVQLAIWAVGQLKMLPALDKIAEIETELAENTFASFIS